MSPLWDNAVKYTAEECLRFTMQNCAGYIGRLANGPLQGGLLKSMLLDSWECSTQTWTTDMEKESTQAAGDVFPADIMEYFKHADVPMCEFWHPFSEGYVGSLNFKPIKPTVSAARLYGKPRVAAEAFTSFNLTWDEHCEMLKEVANVNTIEGATHLARCGYMLERDKPVSDLLWCHQRLRMPSP